MIPTTRRYRYIIYTDKTIKNTHSRRSVGTQTHADNALLPVLAVGGRDWVGRYNYTAYDLPLTVAYVHIEEFLGNFSKIYF